MDRSNVFLVEDWVWLCDDFASGGRCANSEEATGDAC
jgi:hypothetical protein